MKPADAMNDDIYMTDEELSNMSPEEITDWLTDVNRALLEAQESGKLTMPAISLDDLNRAYESEEYREFLDQSEDMDITPVMFEDGEDIDRINSCYKTLKDLGDGPLTDKKIKAYEDLYSSLYPYIRRVNPLWEAGADRLDIWAKLQDEYRTVYTVTPENADPFSNLCSADEYALIGQENICALGCVRRIDGEETACGIIIFEIHPEDEVRFETVAEIKWLYVDENCRGMHVGDSLMSAMYHALNRAGISSVCADVPMKDILPVMVGEFLSGWWLYFNLQPRMKVCLSLSRVMDSVSSIAHAQPAGYMKMSYAGADLISNGIKSIYKNSEEEGYTLTDTDTLDPDLSMILLIGSKPKCFILVDRTPSGILKVRRLGGNVTDDKPYLELIKFAVTEGLKKYPPETQVIIEPVSDMSAGLFERLFPDVTTPVYLAGANLSFEDELTSDTFEELRIMYEKEKADRIKNENKSL